MATLLRLSNNEVVEYIMVKKADDGKLHVVVAEPGVGEQHTISLEEYKQAAIIGQT